MMRILSAFRPEDVEPPDVTIEGDAMIIDCRGCDIAPVPGSEECLRCMVRLMSGTGGTERIVLRTGMDTEISGTAGEAVKDAASVMRWSYTEGRPRMQCRSCPMERNTVMDAVWEAFPNDAVSEGRRLLDDDPPDRPGCEECVRRTSAALDQVESGLSDILAKMIGRCPR